MLTYYLLAVTSVRSLQSRHVAFYVRAINIKPTDKYLSIQLKYRAKRGSGIRRHVTASAPVSRNWQDFLRVDMNKSELFRFISEHLMKMRSLVTCGTSVLSSDATCKHSGLPHVHRKRRIPARSRCYNVLIRSLLVAES